MKSKSEPAARGAQIENDPRNEWMILVDGLCVCRSENRAFCERNLKTFAPGAVIVSVREAAAAPALLAALEECALMVCTYAGDDPMVRCGQESCASCHARAALSLGGAGKVRP